MPYTQRLFSPDVSSFSELDTLASCEEKWYQRFVLGGPSEPSEAMKRGTGFHSLTQAWWVDPWVNKVPWDRQHVWEMIAQLEKDEDFTLEEESVDLLTWLTLRYAEVNADLHKRVKILGTELELESDFPYFPVKVISHLDELWELDGEVWAVERKTMRDWRRLELIDYTIQESLYIWQLQQNGYKVDGLIFDAAKTYQWKPEKPTQQQMIESVDESAMGPPWGPMVGQDDPEKPGKTLTLAAAKRQWARAAVEAHPGVDRPAQESFQRHWLDRTPDQIEAALRAAQRVLTRRQDILAGMPSLTEYHPIRNIGPGCHGCSAQEACFEGLNFAIDITLEED